MNHCRALFILKDVRGFLIDMGLKKRILVYRDGILGYQFNKRLESFASYYSQSLLRADFKEKHTLLWF